MLSVGKNTDGSKGLGFGGDMEGTELEEGEACSYLDDADPTVDPDIYLAYLDEKLHSVLGHLQKDFEGGVSAENLGAKFGGYGSFLPTYQRSPVGSHPKTPDVQNHALKSPNNFMRDGGFHDFTTPEVDPLPAHFRDIDNTRASSSTTKPSTIHDSVKADTGMQHGQTKKVTSKVETIKKSTVTDQKKLKVRIRVGSDNLSAQNKADIYSGLGLHASSSSSFEDSPQSEEWSREVHDVPEESPSSILHIMTSFPLVRSLLLSPLAEDLSYLTGNKKIQKRRRPESVSTSETGKSNKLTVRPGSSRHNGKLPASKNAMSSKINGIPVVFSNRSSEDVQDSIIKLSMETHDEASASEGLISKALRLPLLSTNETPVSIGKVSDDNPTGASSFDENHLDQKGNRVCEIEAQTRKYMIRKGVVEPQSSELNPPIEVEAVKPEITDNSTSKTDINAGLQKQVGSYSAFKDIGSSKAMSKPKMTRSDTNTADVFKVQVRDGSSSQSKIEKSINRGSKYAAKSSKLQSDVRKPRDTYKELFGNLNSEHEVNENELLKFPSAHVIKDSQVTDIGNATSNNYFKVRGTIKKVENTTGAVPAVIQHPSFRGNTVASILKTKNGLTEASIAMGSQDLPGAGDLAANIQPAVKTRSWNGVKMSPSLTDLNDFHLTEPSDLVVDENKKLSKDKQKPLECSSNGGIINENMKRCTVQGSPGLSKKYKEDPADELMTSEMDRHVPSRNGDLNTSSVMAFVDAGKDCSKSTEAPSPTSLKTKDRVCHSADGSSDKRSDDGRYSSGKKRKALDSQESRHSESLPTSGLNLEEKMESLKDSNQRHRGKEKNARVSSQETRVSSLIRESIAAQSDHTVTKNLKPAQIPNNISLKQGVEDVDFSGRELTSSHLIMEATSSASKISDSHKSKAKIQVIEGSPVESVSSSPLRSRSNDRHASNGRNNFDKECPPDFSRLSVSPQRFSNHEINGKNGAVGRAKKDTSMEKASVIPHKGTEFSSVLHFQNSGSGGKNKEKPAAYDELPDQHTVNEVSNLLDHQTCEQISSNNGLREETYNNTLYLSNGTLPDKKGCSLPSMDKLQKSNLLDSSPDGTLFSKHTVAEAESCKKEKKHDMKVTDANSKKGTRVNSGGDGGRGVTHHIFPSLSASKKDLVQEHVSTAKLNPPEKMELLETSLLRGKSVLRYPIVGGSSPDISHTRHPSGPGRRSEIQIRDVYDSEQDDSLKGPKAVKKADSQNGCQPTTSRHDKVTDLNAPSPARRDSSTQSAANAVKEAKTLKHMADRVKSSGSNAESIGLYFQASLKFLLGASLLESSTSESRHGDIVQSTQMYSSTAKLCEFCANEFEKAKDMASAALAYKCTEVAYMRVIHSSHTNANRDRHELQTALQIAPPDVDILNNAATEDKVHVAKGMNSTQVASSHVISARNRPGFERLLKFAKDVNFAMEASRKSRVALAAVSAPLEQGHSEDGISSIKRALDFSFQDVDGLLSLIRIAMEAISR